MFTSVQNDQLPDHHGVQRTENTLAATLRLGPRLATTRGLPGLLLTAGLAALAVVADQMITTWADGRLLLAWVVLWAVLLVAIALFSEVAAGWSASVEEVLSAWSAQARSNAADERTWALARSDPRCMADLQAARWRAEVQAQAIALAPADAPAASHERRSPPSHGDRESRNRKEAVWSHINTSVNNSHHQT